MEWCRNRRAEPTPTTRPRLRCWIRLCKSTSSNSRKHPSRNCSHHDIISSATWRSFTAWKPSFKRDSPASALSCPLCASPALPYNGGFSPHYMFRNRVLHASACVKGRTGMATTDVTLQGAPGRLERKPVVNDMSIQVATVNGSGSQSSNTVLLRSIFQMGVPVSGKNLFPSNIAGLPTWYTIRANKDGYIARKKEIDFLVAMNPETAQEDVKSLGAGAVVVYDEPLNLRQLRNDLIFYAVPYDIVVSAVWLE